MADSVNPYATPATKSARLNAGDSFARGVLTPLEIDVDERGVTLRRIEKPGLGALLREALLQPIVVLFLELQLLPHGAQWRVSIQVES